MPAFSFHWPRFLRSHHSRSHPSQADPRDDAAISHKDVNAMPTVTSHSQQNRQGMFYEAHDLIVTGTFVDGNVTNNTYNNTTSAKFMEKLLEKTIPGAEFDSSDRDPPPRCHPGTRLAILERCLHSIRNCDANKKIRWVVGGAGVGKSAVMQSVVESPELVVSCHASVFFSINGRDDGTKAIMTISYQLAAKCKPYRQLIEKGITHDPSLLRSSMAKQFLKLIVEPFIHNPQLNSAGRILIVVDGVDECKDSRTQLELLRLISDLCIKYPSSPLVWLVASRPEQHITSFFSRSEIMPAYEKEEIPVNSNEARADVERFLRDEFMEIKKASDSVDPRWPEEQDLWKLANAAGGLFAYAQTATRYIADSTVGSPASQLSDVLNVIDKHPLTDVPPEDHPMALLDALYARILSNVPSRTMMHTRKLLLVLGSDWALECKMLMRYTVADPNFLLLCNWLGMTPEEAYAAINRLRCLLRVPKRDAAHREMLEPLHKSFMDYISDVTRSRFSPDIQHETHQLMAQCAFRILNEAPDGIDFGDIDYRLKYGYLRRGPGTGGKISLAWKVDEDVDCNDNAMRFLMYKLAFGEVVAGMDRGDLTFQSEFCIRLMTTRFEKYLIIPSFDALMDLAFTGSRRHEFMVHGILQQMPVKAIDVSLLFGRAKLQFRRPATAVINPAEPWNPSCTHEWKGKWGEGDDQDCKTTFGIDYCRFCMERLKQQLEDWKSRSPDYPIPTLFTSTGDCCVEFRFIDPDDGMSEWTYWVWLLLSLEERKEYGSTV